MKARYTFSIESASAYGMPRGSLRSHNYGQASKASEVERNTTMEQRKHLYLDLGM